ncbi:t-SNARE, partial [Tilletiaria anomala UBC 951]
MEDFFRQLSDISDTVTLIDDQVSAIGAAHANSLDQADEASAHMAEQEVTHLQSLARSLLSACKAKLLGMFRAAQLLPLSSPDRATQLAQIAAAKERLKGVLQRYYELEQSFRAKYRARAERKYRSVDPTATPEELSAVLNDDDNGQAFFQQAMRSCTRPGEARTALREVQERHEDIRKIERTLAELAALFNDIDILLTEHGDEVSAIFHTTEVSKEAMKEAESYLAQGAEHARRARRRRCCILGIVLAL